MFSRHGRWPSLAVALVPGMLACTPWGLHEPPAPAAIELSLFLIGDAGEADPRAERGGMPLDSLTAHVARAPERSIVVFLGDNVYPDGIPEEGAAEYADARRRLAVQVRAIPDGATAYFVPGNHDWASEEAYGLFSVRRQGQLVTQLAEGRPIRVLPPDGCPGPATVDAGRLRLIALDTQWWLHNYIVREDTTTCTNTMAGVTAALRREVQAPGEGRVVVVAGHHPMLTGGEHGGYCGITGPFHRFAGRSQDIMSSANKRMRDSLAAAFSAAPPMAYVAGHDHSLQVLYGGGDAEVLLVSGAGSPTKPSCAVTLRESFYTSPGRVGFMRLDILRDRGVFLRVYRYRTDGSGGLSYTRWIEEPAGGDSQ